MSSAVVVSPRLNRKAPRTTGSGQPIASRTGDGSVDPLAQRRTGRTGHSHLVERHQQRLAVQTQERDVGRLRQARRAAPLTVISGTVAAQPLFETVAQGPQPIQSILCFAPPYLQGSQHAHRQRHRFGAWAEPLLLKAPVEYGVQLRAAAQHQRTYAHRSVKFVRGQAHSRHAQGTKVHGQLSDSLHRVAVHRHGRSATHVSHFGNRLKHAGFIISEHDADQPGLGGKQLAELIQVNHAVRGHRQPLHVVRPTVQMLGRAHDAGMLDGRDDDAGGLRPGQSADRQVIGLRTAAGENHFVRVRIGSHQLRDAFACILQDPACFPSGAMKTGGIPPRRGVALRDGSCHLRVERGRRIVIEIDAFCRHGRYAGHQGSVWRPN